MILFKLLLWCVQESEITQHRKVSFMKQEVIVKTESSSLASATVQRQETQALELVERSLSQGRISNSNNLSLDNYMIIFIFF